MPRGWARASIADVTSRTATVDWNMWPAPTFTYIDISSIDSGSARVAVPKELEITAAPSRARQIVRSGDTLFSTVRTYLRNIGYVDDSLDGQIASTGFCVLRPTPGIHARYLFYYSQSSGFIRDVSVQQRGVSYPAVTDGQVRNMPMPVPPTAEQVRIVAAIEEQFSRLDAGVAALERVRQNLKRMRAAVYEAAVTGQLEPLGSDGNVSVPWPQHPLGDVLESIGAGKSLKCREYPAGADEWGVVKVSAMTWGRFLGSENKTVLPGRDIDERLEIRPGDLLVSRANTVDYVGAVVLVGNCRPRLLLSDKSLRLQPFPGILPEWLVVALRSRTARRYIEGVATGTSDSMRNISQPKLKALRIPVPSIVEQEIVTKEVSRQLSLIDALEQTLRSQLESANQLRSSILSVAFSGQLVPQDPNDEPASILLERITAERAASNGHQPSRKPRAAKASS